MQPDRSEYYARRLAVVVGSRLIFNMMAETEAFFGIRSLGVNGPRRCFLGLPRLRAAYRDLRAEAEEMTDGAIALDWLMPQYEGATAFYKSKVARRKNPEEIALALLRAYYNNVYPATGAIISIIAEAIKGNINPALLTLLLLKALPCFTAKGVTQRALPTTMPARSICSTDSSAVQASTTPSRQYA